MKKFWLGTVIVVGLLLVIPSGCTSVEKVNGDKIIIGVKTSNNDAYHPLAKLLSQRLKESVEIQAYSNLSDLNTAVANQKVNFIFASPTDYLKLNKKTGVKAIATKLNKGGTPYCQGTLIVAKSKKVKTIADLKGKKFRFGPDKSFNKYYAALAVFKEQGLKLDELKECSYGTGCSGIGRTILADGADAGVVCDYSWDAWVGKQSKDPDPNKLIVLAKGPKLRDLAVAAAPKTPEKLQDRFLTALLSLKGEKVLLQPPMKAKGFSRSSDHDYDSLRKILEDLN